mgnify:FL=1
MRILALETSAMSGSVALLEGDRLLVERTPADPTLRTAQWLTVGIEEALREAGWKPADVELIAVTLGPGSFTGLRVGVMTAKTLAYALSTEVVGVCTLQAIAAQGVEQAAGRPIAAVLNAHRGQLFAAEYRAQGDGLEEVRSAEIVEIEAWLAEVSGRAGKEDEPLVIGPMLGNLEGQLPAGAAIAEAANWEPRAATIGRLGWRKFQQHGGDDLWKLLPVYLRPSYAEEKRG